MEHTRIPGGWRTEFLLLAATWGSSFLYIKVLDKQWPAIWVALGRVSLGAVTLLLLTRLRREQVRFEKRVWIHLMVAAALVNAVPFTRFAYGEQHGSSIAAGLWNATTPLWVLAATLAAFGEERPSRGRMLGLAVGFAGVAIVLGPWRGLGGGQLLAHLACAGAAVCYGLGFPYIRRYLASRTETPVTLAAGQLVCATCMLAVLAPLARAPTVRIGLDGLGSILALGVLGTGVAYVLNYSIVRAAGSTVASTVTYLIPVFSTVLGVIILGEPLSWNQPAGALVLLVGIATRRGGSRHLRPGLAAPPLASPLLASLSLVTPSLVNADRQPDRAPQEEPAHVVRRDDDHNRDANHCEPDRRPEVAPIAGHRNPTLSSLATRLWIEATARNASLRWLRVSALSVLGST